MYNINGLRNDLKEIIKMAEHGLIVLDNIEKNQNSNHPITDKTVIIRNMRKIFDNINTKSAYSLMRISKIWVKLKRG